jgi:molecular chaperone DnaK (HSP70)
MPDFSLGLDFGTSTTLVALPGLEPRVLPIGNEGGNSWLPSVLATFDKTNWLMGEDADKGAIAHQFRSPKSAITHDKKYIANADGIEIEADEAIRKIMEEVVSRCKERGFSDFSQVRLSCPAMWTGEQRKRLVRLVNESGLVADIDQVIDEPISASIAWWWSRFSKGLTITEKKRALIFDLGGGTLDVAVLDIFPRPGSPELTILAARGIAIAGDELDKALAAHITRRLKQEKKYEISKQKDSAVIEIAIRLEARDCKERLSNVEETIFFVDEKIADVPSIRITRIELNEVYAPQMAAALNCVDAALREARMKSGDNLSGPEIAKLKLQDLADQIDFVVLAGGMAQIKKVEADLQALMRNATVERATSDSRSSTSAIVMGVANLNDFADLNIHRPNFDFIVSYLDKFGLEHRSTLYEAFTPLYLPEQVMRGDLFLGFQSSEWLPPTPALGDKVLISIETIGGRRVTLRNVSLNKDAEGLEFKADRLSGIRMKLYANGQIVISDNHIGNVTFRVKEWPHIRWNSNVDSSRFALKLETIPNLVRGGTYIDAWRYK